MKTRYRHIHFKKDTQGGLLPQYDHPMWFCMNNHTDHCLGWCDWDDTWNKYAFAGRSTDCVFDEQCLTDIAAFLRQLNEGK